MILDHLFALPRGLDPAAPLAGATLEAADAFSRALRAAGFREGSSRAHPGQGTANRRLFLDDLMIECLSVDDATALDHPRGAVLRLGTRFRDPSASGLGLAFRPDADAPGALPAPDFDAVAYRPAYLPESLHIDVAREPSVAAPLLFHLPFARRPPGVPEDDQPRDHANGARRVAALRLETPAALPDAVRAALDGVGIARATGPAECLHLRLDGPADGFELDLRPRLPLRLHA